MPPKRSNSGGQRTLNLRVQKTAKTEPDFGKKAVQKLIGEDDDIQVKKQRKDEIKQLPTNNNDKGKKPQIKEPAKAREVEPGVTKTMEEAEELLRKFDVNNRYGPCMSSTRMERFERAKKLNLNPPESILKLLQVFPELQEKSLWHGRVHQDLKW